MTVEYQTVSERDCLFVTNEGVLKKHSSVVDWFQVEPPEKCGDVKIKIPKPKRYFHTLTIN